MSVESANLSLAKFISLMNNSYTPNPNINKTMPIKNKSIDEIILKSNSLLVSILLFSKDFIDYCLNNVPTSKRNNTIDEMIDRTTDINTINLVLHNAFSNLFPIITIFKIFTKLKK